MEARELRIGNWYYLSNIMSGDKTPERFIIWPQALDFEAYGEPIPLTPEILEKAGFEFISSWVNKEDDGICYRLRVGNMSLCMGMMGRVVTLLDSDNISTGTNIEYVHQLQNLYFALTGNELTIDL